MTIENLDSLMRKLDELGGNDRPLVRGVQKAAMKVQGDAKLLAPTDTNRLRDSIQADVEKKDGEVIGRVSTNVEYAAYVEFGTGQRGESSPSPPKSPDDIYHRQDWVGMPAQPYLYPAAKQNQKTVTRIVANELRKEIRKLGRGR